MMERIERAVQLAKGASWGEISQAVRIHWHSEAASIGLRRDISIPFTGPAPRFP